MPSFCLFTSSSTSHFNMSAPTDSHSVFSTAIFICITVILKNRFFSLKAMLTGLSQRVAYFYPTGVTLLHTSSPSSFRAWFRAVAWTRVCAEITWATVAGRGLVWHRARLHQQRGRAQLGQEDNPSPEPRLLGRGDPVVAWQGRRRTNNCWLKVFFYVETCKTSLRHCRWHFLLQFGVISVITFFILIFFYNFCVGFK